MPKIMKNNKVLTSQALNAEMIINENIRKANEEARKVWEAYNNTKTYVIGNKVEYNGSSYICIQNSTGKVPTDFPLYWKLIAAAGAGLTDASQLPITDTGNYYTTDNTGDALQEVGLRIGDISLLETTSNTDLVGSINETNGKMYDGKNYKINNPYRDGGNLNLKGQIHCHTTGSDGLDTPLALVTAYKNAGYNFVTITDHNVITPNPEVSGITWIGTSCEDSQDKHINAFDISVRDDTLKHYQDCLTYHKSNGKMTSLNHPNWSYDQDLVSKALSQTEILKLHDCNFIEVFNGTTNTYAENMWDWALSSGKKIFGTATDDCHNLSTQLNLGWVVVHADVNSKDHILDALRKGNFYSSNGNDISISLIENVITATSTAMSNFSFVGRDGKVMQTNSNATSATYAIRGDELYVRVVSTRVSDSKKAWSQPIFIDNIGHDGIATDILNFNPRKNWLINGNFDIFQRATSAVNTLGGYFTADRWAMSNGTDSGVFPNITYSKQAFEIGEIPNSCNFYRVNVDGAGTSLGAASNFVIQQSIEGGTRYLCGWGKKVTVSFYARSSIVGKKLAVNITQGYGTGGSNTEQLVGTTINLTTNWIKYNYTFLTNTLDTKTLSTIGDDAINLRFFYVWGSNYISRFNAVSAETFVGAGNIDIAQVKLEEGDNATSFIPKSFDEELISCQRYYEKGNFYIRNYSAIAGQQIGYNLSFKREKRIIPTFSSSIVTTANVTNSILSIQTTNIDSIGVCITATNPTSDTYAIGTWEASAEF